MPPRNEAQSKILEVFQQEVLDHFQQTVEFTTDKTAHEPSLSTSPKLLSLISFMSETAQGNLHLLCSLQELPELLPDFKSFFAEDELPPVTDPIWADAFGELANQLLGRFKNEIYNYGITLQMGVPSIVQSLHIEPVSSKYSSWDDTFCVAGEGFNLSVYISMLMGENFELKDYSKESNESMMSTGDMMIF